MEREITVVAEDKLFAFCSTMLRMAGMPDADASYAAHCLVQTNLWGTDSHGVIRLPSYIKRLQNGAINPKPTVKVLREVGAVARLHGDDGHGYIVAHKAMAKAISLAMVHGLGLATVRNSNHFGAAGLFAREAAEKNMIGIAMSNVYANMVAPGSRHAVIGNNPIAFAVPIPGMRPFVLDFCLSKVALGKLLVAKDKGEKIPLDWAVDEDGNPTDDPEKGIAGAMLPMAGHKGYGLALVVEMFTGMFSGGAILDAIKGMVANPDEPGETSHTMIAINPLTIMDEDEWEARTHALHAKLKETPMLAGHTIVFPGEPEDAAEIQRRRSGIPVPAATIATLNALAEPFGVRLEI
ncbi:MAG: Ldh family oxidoreductase [Deltaproteobacteria bacterium]|nr:Ldh family oxidoreductase [Deltaproteobacteria bacterium]